MKKIKLRLIKHYHLGVLIGGVMMHLAREIDSVWLYIGIVTPIIFIGSIMFEDVEWD